jgi:hypothetical protein
MTDQSAKIDLQGQFMAYTELRQQLPLLIRKAKKEFITDEGLVRVLVRKFFPTSEERKASALLSFFNIGAGLRKIPDSKFLTKYDDFDFEWLRSMVGISQALEDAVQSGARTAQESQEFMQAISQELSTRTAAIADMLEITKGKKVESELSFRFVGGDEGPWSWSVRFSR